MKVIETKHKRLGCCIVMIQIKIVIMINIKVNLNIENILYTRTAILRKNEDAINNLSRNKELEASSKQSTNKTFQ